MKAQVPITCKCKVSRCSVCSCCSRCGCGHDGKSIEHKLARKQGRARQACDDKSSVAPRKKRATNTYRPGTFVESPYIPFKKKVIQAEATARKLISAITDPTSTNSIGTPLLREGIFQRPADIMRAFGLGDKVDRLYAHIPNIQSRSIPSTWQNSDNPSIQRVFNSFQKLMLRICTVFCGMSEDAGHSFWNGFVQSLQAKENPKLTSEAVEELARSLALAKRGSIEKRVIRALLCGIYTFAQLEELVRVVPGFSMSRTSFVKGGSDFKQLAEGNSISIASRSLMRYQGASVDGAIAFILSPANVSYLSWGIKKAVIDGKVLILPAITRKKATKHIYDAYVHPSTPHSPESKLLSRAAFYRVVAALTAGDVRIRKAVDYVTGFLVNDCFAVMERIAENYIADGDVRQRVLKEMEVARSYLNYGFGRESNDQGSTCVLHDHHYGLDAQHVRPQSNEPSWCHGCQQVFKVYAEMVNLLTRSKAPALTVQVVEDCAAKGRLFLGHRVRVLNQQTHISQIVDEMQRQCLRTKGSSEALVVMDFKMKLEPMYFREKTAEHYGKRGISWHGIMIHYFNYEIGEQAAPMAAENRIYVDHICDGDSKQDREAVISLTEAMLMRIRKDLPHIKSIVLQSDNATCYQNALVVLLLPYLSVVHGVQVSRFIHTETQDGKSVLDAHFARSMGVLKIWIREGHNCVTPTQVVIGLKSHGGLPNCIVEVVEHDREKLDILVASIKPMEKQFKTYVKRVNDVHLSFVHDEPRRMYIAAAGSDHNYRHCPEFVVTAFSYSGIGAGVAITCQPHRRLCFLRSSLAPPAAERNIDTELQSTTESGDEEAEEEIWDCEEYNIIRDLSESKSENPNISDDDCCEEEVLGAEHILAEAATGPVTGIQIATQGQLLRRTRRWRNQISSQCSPCEGEVAFESRDIVSYAVRKALQMSSIQQALYSREHGQLSIIDTGEHGSDDISIATLLSYSHFRAGWAVRPRAGHMYGQKYIGEFKNEIRELFDRGQQQKARKMGPGRMLESLKLSHPDRFDLPSESEIRQEIARLMRIKPDHSARYSFRSDTAGDFSTGAAQFLESLLATNPRITPKNGLAAFREAFGSDVFTDAQIKKRISNTKSSLRRLQSKT